MINSDLTLTKWFMKNKMGSRNPRQPPSPPKKILFVTRPKKLFLKCQTLNWGVAWWCKVMSDHCFWQDTSWAEQRHTQDLLQAFLFESHLSWVKLMFFILEIAVKKTLKFDFGRRPQHNSNFLSIFLLIKLKTS